MFTSVYVVVVVFHHTVGPINTLIYPVEGGMEDWLYAAGWDKAPLRECWSQQQQQQPQQQLRSGAAGGRRRLLKSNNSSTAAEISRTRLRGGKEANNTLQGNVKINRKLASGTAAAGTAAQTAVAENRAVVFLVETSDRKKPLDASLGGSEMVSDACMYFMLVFVNEFR